MQTALSIPIHYVYTKKVSRQSIFASVDYKGTNESIIGKINLIGIIYKASLSKFPLHRFSPVYCRRSFRVTSAFPPRTDESLFTNFEE